MTVRIDGYSPMNRNRVLSPSFYGFAYASAVFLSLNEAGILYVLSIFAPHIPNWLRHAASLPKSYFLH
jgi:hypothetical protein